MTAQPSQQKPWLQRNWIWLITIAIVVMLTLFISSPIGTVVTDIAKVSAESKIYEDAWQLTSENKDIIKTLGTLESISKLDIIEGQVKYADDNDTVNMTVRVVGDKGKGKLDISATREGIDWDYNLIKVRLKNSKESIMILEK